MIAEPTNYHESVAATILQALVTSNLVKIVVKDVDVGTDTMEREVSWIWSSQAVEQIGALLDDCYEMEEDA